MKGDVIGSEEDVFSLMKTIAGEVVMSNEPGNTLKKWRVFFELSQTKLAGILGVSPSVICDYECGRRKSPGALLVKRIVGSIIKYDLSRGGEKLSSILRIMNQNLPAGAIVDVREFSKSVRASDIRDELKVKIIANKGMLKQPIYGYTIIDSVLAITELSSGQLIKVFGNTPKRCLIFTNSRSGRSVMVALKTAQALGELFKPSFVILHNILKVDLLAIKIARNEGIILGTCRSKDITQLQKKLLKIRQ